MKIDDILNRIIQIEHGFKHILAGADEILASYSREHCYALALELFKHDAYQVRMLATTILGRLAYEERDALIFLKDKVSRDEDWRVQEMLAKAFDEVCRHRGYGASLSLIEEWLRTDNPYICRAVIEGLRVWTSRPFFREHPSVAIALIAQHKAHKSQYLRKSVGNALRDISKKHSVLIERELEQWDLSNPHILFTYNLVSRFTRES